MAGVGGLLVTVAVQSYVGSLGRGAAAERNFSTYALAASFGQIAGPAFGGIASAALTFRGAFLIAAALAAATAVGAVVAVPRRDAAGAPQAPGSPHPRQSTSSYVRSKSTLLAIMASCLMSVPEVLRIAFLPVYLESQLGLDLSAIGYALSSFSIAGLVAKALLPMLARTVGRFRLLLGICAATAVSLLAIPSTATVAAVTVCIALAGFAFGIGRPLSMAMAANSARPEDMGRVIGIRLTGNRVADFVLPVLFGLAASSGGIGAAFYLGAALLTAGLPPIALGGRNKRPRDDSTG